MMTVNNILDYLAKEYPLETACDFDNVGLLVGDGNATVTRAVVCLDCDIDALNYAKSVGAELIVTHHPVIFDGLKNVISGSVVYEAVRSGISVISMHTNLDIARCGVTESLCNAIGLKNVKPFVAHDEFLIREAQCDIQNADQLAEHIKNQLGGAVKYVNSGKQIRRVLVCSGSGGNYLTDVINCGYDALISADIKHNVFVDAINNGVSIFDAGHYNSENIIVKPLCKQLENTFSEVEFLTFDNTKIKSV